MPKLTIVFDNIPLEPGLQTDWGFAAVITGFAKTILFDTGCNADVLLANMETLEIDPVDIRTVVLSHPHEDHIGGLAGFLRVNPGVEVFVPDGFPCEVIEQIELMGAEPLLVGEGGEIVEDVWTTGPLFNSTVEQGLVLSANGETSLVTGCAHPGIDIMVEEAAEASGATVQLVVGGFHLLKHSKRAAHKTAEKLRDLGVERVAHHTARERRPSRACSRCSTTASWKAASATSSNSENGGRSMGSPLCHFEFAVSDPEKSKAFYGKVFGWKFDTDPNMNYTMIDPGGEPKGGMMKKPDQMPAFALSVYFCVDSVDETIATAQAAGATLAVPKTEIPGMGFWAFFLDPDGIAVGVYESSK